MMGTTNRNVNTRAMILYRRMCFSMLQSIVEAPRKATLRNKDVIRHWLAGWFVWGSGGRAAVFGPLIRPRF